MIFYEAPHKLPSTLCDLRDAFGAERRISLCRELTKLHEEVKRTTLGEAAAYYEETKPRGEFVLVVEGAKPVVKEVEGLELRLKRVQLLRQEGLSLRDAARRVAEETGTSRKELYDAALNL